MLNRPGLVNAGGGSRSRSRVRSEYGALRKPFPLYVSDYIRHGIPTPKRVSRVMKSKTPNLRLATQVNSTNALGFKMFRQDKHTFNRYCYYVRRAIFTQRRHPQDLPNGRLGDEQPHRGREDDQGSVRRGHRRGASSCINAAFRSLLIPS